MTQHSIVFLDRDSLIARVRPPAFAHAWTEHAHTRGSEETVARLAGASIAITNKVPLREAELAQLPGQASRLYAQNVVNLVTLMTVDGVLAPDLADEILAGCCVTRAGRIEHEPTRLLVEGA